MAPIVLGNEEMNDAESTHLGFSHLPVSSPHNVIFVGLKSLRHIVHITKFPLQFPNTSCGSGKLGVYILSPQARVCKLPLKFSIFLLQEVNLHRRKQAEGLTQEQSMYKQPIALLKSGPFI